MRRCFHATRPSWLVLALGVSWLACDAWVGTSVEVAGDGGPDDTSSSSDAGAEDAGVADAGIADAGIADAGVADAGVADAGVADAGVADGGPVFASGPLRVHPQNPRYFADARGRVVYLTGSHTWDNLIDDGPTDPPAAFDYAAYLTFLTQRGHNFIRLWRAENAKGGEGSYSVNYWFAPMPYARPGPGLALDGKPRFDLNQFNQLYFDRLRQRVLAAGARGIYVSVMLFDGWSIRGKGGSHDPWPGHPFHRSNNVNGIDGDPNGDGQGDEIQTLSAPQAVASLQEAYVQKVIDTVNDLDNVLYEISNESEGNSEAWQYRMIQFIKTYEAGKPKQHPVGMTVEYPGGSNADLRASPADWISPNGDVNNPAVADGTKIVLGDTDHLCGICGDPAWVWRSLTRGHNPIFMDPYSAGVTTRGASANYNPNNANDVGIRLNLGYARQYAQRMNLAAMTPQGARASTGYALVNAALVGAEYLVFLPNGGSVSVDLAQSSKPLSVEWFDPATGQASAGATVTGGATRSFTAPFGGQAVLYVYEAP